MDIEERQKWRKKIECEIASAARSGRLLYYTDLLPDDVNEKKRRMFYFILDEINEKQGETLLPSALVVGEEIGMPGEGFFRKNKKHLGLLGNPSQNRFAAFAREARKLCAHYGAKKNCGILIDADQVGTATTKELLSGIDEKPVVCRAYGNAETWGIKNNFRDKRNITFFHTPKEEHAIRSATDFRLYAQAVRIVREIHNKKLIDKLYIVSCDKGFKHLTDTVKQDGIEVVWLDNEGNKHALG
ncbi:MAG: hypothetical protein ACR2P5_08655 [Gammaproteobacteria bacterium]